LILLQPNGHRPALAGFTKSSTTASASWRGATVPVFGLSAATATISPPDFHSRRQRSWHCQLIDGEAIVTNASGLAVFDLIRRKRHCGDAVLIAFDLIELEGEDLRRSPIEHRKRKLAKLVRRPQAGIVVNEVFEGDGDILFARACKLGCEGIVSKRLGSMYRSGRSPHWIKVKNPKAPAVKREAEEDWGSPHWIRSKRRSPQP
jgi:hypothetical protein